MFIPDEQNAGHNHNMKTVNTSSETVANLKYLEMYTAKLK
jgi:hypothetical protein